MFSGVPMEVPDAGTDSVDAGLDIGGSDAEQWCNTLSAGESDVDWTCLSGQSNDRKIDKAAAAELQPDELVDTLLEMTPPAAELQPGELSETLVEMTSPAAELQPGALAETLQQLTATAPELQPGELAETVHELTLPLAELQPGELAETVHELTLPSAELQPDELAETLQKLTAAAPELQPDELAETVHELSPPAAELQPDELAETLVEITWPTPAITEVIFIDQGVPNWQDMVEDIQSSAIAGQIEIVTIDSGRDGISQIGEVLGRFSNISTIHLVSHGAAGEIGLGNSILSLETLSARAGEIAQWNTALNSGADLRIYGCNVAASAAGRALTESLAALCDCDVAASDDTTGHGSLGGDWDLEVTWGDIDSDLVFSMEFQQSWTGTLPGDWFDADTGAPLGGPGSGDDLFVGSNGNDTTNALTGDDVLYGNGGNDDLTGDIGDDLILGGAGNDTLHGGNAADVLHGGTGDDILNGEFGLDTLISGGGSDTLNGGNSDDLFLFTGAQHGDVITVDGGSGPQDTIDVSGFGVGAVTQGAGTITVSLGGADFFTINHVNVEIIVTAEDGGNHVPLADAGPDQFVGVASPVTLDASASSDLDLDSLSYQWQQISGTWVSLSDPNVVSPTFTATGPDVLEFALVVSDGSESVVDTVSVVVGGPGMVVVDTALDILDGDTSSISALLADKGADGFISLREAILATNNTVNTGSPDQILFDIADGSASQFYYQNDGVAGSVTLANIADATVLGGEIGVFDFDPDHPHSWFRIDLNDAFPELTIVDAVNIDGYTQWGSSQNTLAVGSDAVLRIEITNSAADSNRGFLIDSTGGGSSISGLVINELGAAAILTQSGADGNTFRGNHIGTDVTGTIGIGNQEGIHLRSGSNLVGGSDPGDRNVLADNNSRGIVTFTFGPIESGNIVQNNYIGVDSSGLQSLGNGGAAGIQVYNQDGMQIVGNVISGNAGHGIVFLAGGDALNTIVQGNFIGVGADGTTVVGNDDGIRIESDLATGTLIGGTGAGQENIISANRNSGIVLDGSGVSATTIVGNFIGTGLLGLLDLGNADHGIKIRNFSNNNTMGGITPGSGNVIAFNDKDGVNIKHGLTDGNAILGNSIYGNDGLGIDLGDDGVSVNDNFDGDGGPNDGLNFPVVTMAVTDGATINVSGWFNSSPGIATYRLEFFSSPSANGSGYGEGQIFIGYLDVTTDANGFASFNQSFVATVAAGEVISATATDGVQNTSEFGRAMAAVASVTTAPVNGIWMSTEEDVAASGAPGLGTWTDSEIISFGGPSLELESGGTVGDFSSVIDLDIFGAGDVSIDGIHYVTQAGTSIGSIVLQAGDILLSTADDESFFGGTFDVAEQDVFLFRPDIVGDYSSGNMSMVLDMSSPGLTDPDLGFGDLWSFTLVEQDVTLGGYNLFAGEILFTRQGGLDHQDVYVFHVGNTGLNVTTGTADKLIEGTVLGFSDKIIGLDLVETTIDVGDETLAVGTLLVSLDGDTRILDADADTSDDFDVTRHDIIAIDINQTEQNGGTQYNGAYILFEGLDVGLDSVAEDIGAFTIMSTTPGNSSPVINNNQLTLNEDQTITLDSSNFNASDAETPDSALTFTVSNVNGGHFALSTDTGTPIFAFTQAQIDAGDIVFVDDGNETAPSYDVEVKDGAGLIDGPQAGTINFTNVNDAPIAIIVPIAFGVNEDAPPTPLGGISISDVDAGLNSLEVEVTVNDGSITLVSMAGLTVTGGGNGTASITVRGSLTDLNNALATLRYQPDAEFSGTDVLTLNVDDLGNTGGGPLQHQDTANIIVTPVNDDPTVSGPVTAAATEDDAGFVVDMLAGASDVEGDTLNVSGLTLTGGNAAGVSVAGNSLNIDPSAYNYLAVGESEIITFSYTIIDGNGGSVAQTATITISGVNDSPLLGNNQLTISEGATVTLATLNVSGTDVDNPDPALVFNVSSVSGGNFALASSPLVPITSFTQAQVSAGDIVFVDDGDEFAPGYDVSVTDGMDTDGPFAATIIFIANNDTPTTSGIPDLTVDEDSADQFFDLHTAFADAEDADSALTYIITGNTNPGLFDLVNITPTDNIQLDFADDRHGSAMITVTATDTGGLAVSSTFLVTVNPVNDQPVVVSPAGPVVVDEDASDSSINLAVVFDDVDIATDGDVLSYSVVSNSNSSLVSSGLVTSTLSLDYQPDQFGSATIVVRATDLAGEFRDETILVTVAPVNDAPVVTNQSIAITDGTAAMGNVLTGSSDVEGDALTVSLVSGPTGGTLVLNTDGSFVFLPNAGFSGSTTFTFVASDGADTSNTGTVSIDISGPLDPDTPTPTPETTDPPDEPDPVLPPPVTTDVGGPIPVDDLPPEPENILPQRTEITPIEELESAVVLKPVIHQSEYKFYELSTSGYQLRSVPTIEISQSRLSVQFLASLDMFGRQIDEAAGDVNMAFVTSIVSMSGLSIGVVSWMLRSGALVTSLMAQMPAWKLIDPLIVLGYMRDEEDDESVEDIIDAGSIDDTSDHSQSEDQKTKPQNRNVPSGPS